MKPKTIKTVYWISTALFALFLLGDAYGGLSQQQAGLDAMKMLGYPAYVLPLVGFSKLCAAIAILQNRFTTLKEWAYAGMVFNCILASASWAIAGYGAFEITFPIIIMAIMFVSYIFWKKLEQTKSAAYFNANSFAQ